MDSLAHLPPNLGELEFVWRRQCMKARLTLLQYVGAVQHERMAMQIQIHRPAGAFSSDYCAYPVASLVETSDSAAVPPGMTFDEAWLNLV